jgi:prepilin-type N-terminal cleavage/methylation domain-containing protein
MTFLPQPKRPAILAKQGGFTLVEIMIVLGILVLLATLGMRGQSIYSDNQKLMNAADDLKYMAKKAWQRSVGEQRDWQIVIGERSLQLQAKGAAREEDQKLLDAADKALERKDGNEMKALDPDMVYRIKRFGDTKWETPAFTSWIFQNSGLCEPLQIQILRQRDGRQEAVEMAFDPLTGGATRTDFSD